MDMLKVLLIDDEPFIVQGLAVLIDWSREGFEIAATAANGRGRRWSICRIIR